MDKVEALKPWPFFGYAPGNYMCKCDGCGRIHTADKRAARCYDCAILASKFSPPSPDAEALAGRLEAGVIWHATGNDVDLYATEGLMTQAAALIRGSGM